MSCVCVCGSVLCSARIADVLVLPWEQEAKDGYWNCPCVPMRERHECHCMLFLTEDNGKSHVCSAGCILNLIRRGRRLISPPC